MMSSEDTRNVMDEFKGMPHKDIMRVLDGRGSTIEIAIENTLRDYNMGTIVRTANAFGIRRIHIIGRKQWNKRGAMMTDKYLDVRYHDSLEPFIDAMRQEGRRLIAVDITDRSKPLSEVEPMSCDVLIFGQEGPGVSPQMQDAADHIVMISQNGSTRSLNVGVAAGIVMYTWSK